ncbi:MAG: flagellin [Halobaculum sp.]|jgi:flagellar protein FlaF
MGISVSASTAVVFLGVFIAAGTLYPALANGTEQVTQAREDAADLSLAQKNTEINVTRTVYDNTTKVLEVNVTNTGTTTLDVPEVNLLVDGLPNTTRGSYEASVAGSTTTEVWLPGEQLNVTVDPGFTTETPARVQVVVDYGVSGAKTVRVVN